MYTIIQKKEIFMIKNDDLLDLVMKKHGLTSDYQLAKLMDVSRQLISSYRKGTAISDYSCLKIADLLNDDPLHIIAMVRAERANKPGEVEAWNKIVKKFKTSGQYILCKIANVIRSHNNCVIFA